MTLTQLNLPVDVTRRCERAIRDGLARGEHMQDVLVEVAAELRTESEVAREGGRPDDAMRLAAAALYLAEAAGLAA